MSIREKRHRLKLQRIAGGIMLVIAMVIAWGMMKFSPGEDISFVFVIIVPALMCLFSRHLVLRDLEE